MYIQKMQMFTMQRRSDICLMLVYLNCNFFLLMLDLSEAVRMQNSMSTVKIKVIMLLSVRPALSLAASLAHIIK